MTSTMTDPFALRAFSAHSSGRRKLVVTGFAAVDVTYGEEAAASAGGTAVNVARAAKRLGWDVEVVGTVGADPAGDLLQRVLVTEDIGTRYLRQDHRWTTPVVLQEQKGDDHVWRFRCPVCGARFAKHRPSPISFADEVVQGLSTPDVVFFDRTSLFANELARRWSALGSAVVFEPAMLGRPHLFDAAASLADIVKFSSERSTEFGTRLTERQGLTVETLGEGGVRFVSAPSSAWTYVAARRVGNVVDSAGAGDWTTAGLITELITRPGGLSHTSSLRAALRDAQALGSAACGWSGVFPQRDSVMPTSDFEAFACPTASRLPSRFSPSAEGEALMAL